MRIAVAFSIAVAVAAAAGCRGKPRGDAPAAPNRDPYRDVTPAKMKQQVEDAQKKEETRDDKLIEGAK